VSSYHICCVYFATRIVFVTATAILESGFFVPSQVFAWAALCSGFFAGRAVMRQSAERQCGVF
jgi:hypothetical protein